MMDAYKRTGEKPVRLLTRPHLEPQAYRYYEIYQKLSCARQYTQGGVLSFTIAELLAAAQLYEIEKGSALHKFVRLMQAMDAVHMDHITKKLAQKTKIQ